MVSIPELWLPILLSAVAVFVASSIINVFLPYHRSDHAKLPNEESVLDAIRAAGVPRGDYAFPHAASMKEMSSPEFTEKTMRGPVGTMTVIPSGPVAMGGSLAYWFGLCLFVGLTCAYLASRTLPAGTDYLMVFRITGTVAFASYALGTWQQAIWFGKSWKTIFKYTFDGLVYAVLTGGFFGWLWP